MPKKGSRKRARRTTLPAGLRWPAYYVMRGLPDPFETSLQRKRRVERERKEQAHRQLMDERARDRDAIPAITALVAKGHLLVTQAYIKSVTHPWQREALTKAIIMGKLAREP